MTLKAKGRTETLSRIIRLSRAKGVKTHGLIANLKRGMSGIAGPWLIKVRRLKFGSRDVIGETGVNMQADIKGGYVVGVVDGLVELTVG